MTRVGSRNSLKYRGTTTVRDLHGGPAMKRSGRLGWLGPVAAAATLAVACGGSVDGGGSGGGGAAAGAGTAASSGAGGGGAGAGGGSAGVAAYGGSSGSSGYGGYGGAAPGCCSSNADCPEYFGDESQGSQCINGVCKPIPPAGACWTDLDCGQTYGSCVGGSVCPCGADCMPDQLGKCSVLPGCCATSADCDQKPGVGVQCVAGNCEPAPPPGQCWTDADCPGSSCKGGCICPCGVICACGGVMGWCEGPPPPPPGCCQTDWQCGDYVYTPCVNGVCKQTIPDHCWKDDECPAGQQCAGAFVCPCGAACGQAETPGKCQ
jgi:hypothetical protein